MTDSTAVARLAASWLLTYPDEALLARLDDIHAAVETLPRGSRVPLLTFLAHVADTPLLELQQHYVAIFDMRRRACPYLTYWTDGETRNRGMALVRFKEAYAEAGFTIADTELILTDDSTFRAVVTFACRDEGGGLLAEGRLRLRP